MKKKILTAILTTLAALTLSTSAFALTEGDWEFQILDNEARITGYTGFSRIITIPSYVCGGSTIQYGGISINFPTEIGGIPVTEVKMASFWEKNFKDAYFVKFPSSVKVINNCFWDEDLQSVDLPEGVEVIEQGAFQGCENLKSVYLPSTLKEIGHEAFENCTALEEIEIPASVTKIDSNAFAYTALRTVDLSKSNIELGTGIFYGCSNLTSVQLNSNLKEIPSSMFSKCPLLKTVDIPGTVTKIGSYAFNECTSLTNIVLPSNLKEIGGDAFSYTTLKEVVIPYGTTDISDSFRYNGNLKSLYIPDTVKYINSDILYESPNCSIYCSGNSYAAKRCKEESISFLTDKSVNSGITVLYNGTRISFHTYDQNPELINSRTLVPLRSIFEAMKAEVTWDDTTKTAIATRDGVTIKIPIGANAIYKDGQSIAVDVPAQILNNRTMIPVRVIAEAFGADVQWNANGKTVLINE